MKDIILDELEENIDFEEDFEENEPDLIDPFDPFDNPTENHMYNESYEDIVPQIKLEGCKLPNIPSPAEKSRIRKFYNITGVGLVIHFILSFFVSNIFNFAILLVMMILNGVSFSEFINGSADDIQNYINSSSILPASTLLSYLIANLLVFFVGSRALKVKPKSFFRTSEFTFSTAVKYIFIAFFLQYAAGVLTTIVQLFMPEADVIGTASSLTDYSSIKYAVVSIMYSCIVAPVTEELLYRGFVLKGFSRVSQRFGILASAFFFGLSHGNIAQFILAFSVGVFMGYIATKHNSLLPSILVHVAVNVLSTLATIISNYFADNIPVVVLINIATIAFAFIGLIVFIFFGRNNVFPKADIRQQFRCKKIACTSAGVIVAALIYFVFLIAITVNQFPTLS